MRIRANFVQTTVAALVLASFCAGCGEDHGLYAVHGKVRYKGQPANGATVIFHREGGSPVPADKELPVATGTVDAQGDFTLTSGDWGDGALPGNYKVLVVWHDSEAFNKLDKAERTKLENRYGRDRARHSLDRLQGYYSNTEKPLLHAEIKSQPNDLPPFELAEPVAPAGNSSSRSRLSRR